MYTAINNYKNSLSTVLDHNCTLKTFLTIQTVYKRFPFRPGIKKLKCAKKPPATTTNENALRVFVCVCVCVQPSYA